MAVRYQLSSTSSITCYGTLTDLHARIPNSITMSVYGLLSRRDQGQKFSAYRLTDLLVAQVPKTLSKKRLNVCAHDKEFSSCWLSDTDVLFGTKDQKVLYRDYKQEQKIAQIMRRQILNIWYAWQLHVYNAHNGKIFDIELFSPDACTTDHKSCRQINSEGYGPSQSHCRNDNTMANSQAAQSSGIRAIAANPSHKSIAIACGSPNNVHVLDLPTLSSKSILQGHTDTTFSVAWIDDRTLISGSRDGTMKCW